MKYLVYVFLVIALHACNGFKRQAMFNEREVLGMILYT